MEDGRWRMEDELVDRGLLEKNYPYYAPPQIVVGVSH